MTPMRRHQMVLEVEFFVNDGEDVGILADEVAKRIFEEIDAGHDSGACVADVRIVSFDKEPLPQTEDEIAEDLADVEEEAARVAEVDAFIGRTPLQSPIVVEDLLGNEFRGVLQAVHLSHISMLCDLDVTMNLPREAIYRIQDESDEAN